ncbi:MAG: alpha,alpha-trehalose-phosphate synthase (UDP-forming) [Pseudomonadales bacterium]
MKDGTEVLAETHHRVALVGLEPAAAAVEALDRMAPRRVERPQTRSRLVVLTCREPAPAAVAVKGNSGGLVAALAPVMERHRGTWISGRPVAKVTGCDSPRLAEDDAPYQSVPVRYPANLHEGFYTRLSNGVLWPLYHSMLHNVACSRSADWRDYRRVNQYFAATAAEQCSRGSFVWVHDYQLSLVPQMLRDLGRGDLEIGFFLHTPFPGYDLFRTLPWAKDILRGMLAADVIGFHTSDYRKNFCECANKLLGLSCDPDAGQLLVNGRRVQLRVIPVGIDVQAIYKLVDDPWVRHAATRLREQLGAGNANSKRKVLLGVDRLDYTKGIDRRLEAVDLLLERHPELRGEFVYAQIAVPSRVEIGAYQDLRSRMEQLTGQVNGRWGTEDWSPVKLLCRSYPLRELVSWYLAADVALVTPYRDGMNLVAKEFCAAHRDRPGALVLSELAGAAEELTEAYLVNPYDLEGMVESIRRAMNVSEAEAQVRMERMNRCIFRRDAHSWVQRFLAGAKCFERV